ncbi:glucose-6-phosphate dehydrogenase [Paenibacillus physcomitrellae]|uniref:Glucose-6-phosphate 1-dehydrogenase n=1 Tax=Paenibacillus physcomitrellae TaxID=1619311 RepID=A0ABQ1GK51_9BACL|nr:glucose-6-phosphate dehydrogenase [Paenibacillus physcomitrellae]GGA45469.1 glucose-6-phosphate 1-dehydrogenase [Paenibacillus physcomitrellae]
MDAMTFVLFGATGDLAKRKIYPALYNLFLDGKLASSFTVIGLGRKEIADPDFQASVKDSLQSFSRKPIDPSNIDSFLSVFHYSSLNVNNVDDFKKLLGVAQKYETELGIPENRLFYLSVAPEFFETIADNINASGLGNTKGWKRLIIEKPFGHDLESARSLQANLNRSFEEEEVFRIDHYLGKPMVQNLEVLGFANPVLQALWNNRYIANVQITANELVGVEDRAGYYDHSGAIRDMFQNHMMQLLMMVTMHLPHRSTPDEVRAKKKNIIKSLRPISKDKINSQIIRGQYGPGSVKGVEVPGYRDENGIGPDSHNDTYVAARLKLETPFWEGVPFYIRTGKRTGEKSTRIVIEFKEPLKASTFPDEVIPPNLLTIEVNPEEKITLQLNMKDKNNTKQLEPVVMEFGGSSKETPEAYENLIHDALLGDSTFFAHWDEVELSWAWVQPVLDAFAANEVPLHFYPAGSDGPDAAHELLAQDGYKWW